MKIKKHELCDFKIEPGKSLNLYIREYNDSSMLGIQINEINEPTRYYWLGASPQGEYLHFKLQIYISRDKNKIWINGKDEIGRLICGFYDYETKAFIDEYGVVVSDELKIDVPVPRHKNGKIPTIEPESRKLSEVIF